MPERTAEKADERLNEPPLVSSDDAELRGSGGVADDPPPALGRTVASGAAWMIISTILSKVATFVAQVILGWWLTKEDFGMFATATAAAKLMALCQDAGVRDYLIQRPANEYKSLSGRVFWFAMAYNTATGLLILLAAWPLAHYVFQKDKIAHLLLVMALGLPLMTPASILYCKLRLDLKFRQSSWIMSGSGLLRQFSSVFLAGVGVGVMSFAWPVVICAAFESAMLWYVTRDKPWSRPAQVGEWPALLGRTKWLIFGAIANLFLDQGPWLVMGPIMSARLDEANKDFAYQVTGLYFWAFNMTAQLGVLLSWNMQLVLTPIFARLNGDRPRQLRTALRAMSGLMMIGSAVSLGMAVVMDPTEKLLFHGTWSAATPAVTVFGICFPFRILYGLTTGLLIATGRSRAWCLTSFFEGMAFTISAAVAACFTMDPTVLAAWSGGALAISRLITTVWVFRTMGAELRDTLVEMLWPWMLACLGAYLAWSAEDVLNLEGIVHRTFEKTSTGAMRVVSTELIDMPGAASWIAHHIQSLGISPSMTVQVLEVLRFGIGATICAATFVILSRLFMGDVMRDTIRLMPAKVRPILAKLAFVKV